jgi:hypothetical protein
MIGKILAHYEITSQLGKGGMGEVYQAKDRKLGRDVAIKSLPVEFVKYADRVVCFQYEAIKRDLATRLERYMANRKRYIVLTVLGLLGCMSFCLRRSEGSDAKERELTADQLVGNHLKSLGTTDALSRIRTRTAEGTIMYSVVRGPSGQASGPAQWASEKGKTAFIMRFNDADYPGEHFARDGIFISIAETRPKHMSYLGEALSYNKWLIIKHGLLGGVLSMDWPLLDIKASTAKIKCRRKKIDGREFYELDYDLPRGFQWAIDDFVEIKMYFDLDTFRHVMTRYRYRRTIMNSTVSFVLLQKFENFKEVDGIMLPFKYTLQYSGEEYNQGNLGKDFAFHYSLGISQLNHNQKIDPKIYRVNQ